MACSPFAIRFGIRPLCYGAQETDAGTEYMVSSESVALEGTRFQVRARRGTGEAIFIDLDGNFHSQHNAPK